jgi:hypothetical protein
MTADEKKQKKAEKDAAKAEKKLAKKQKKLLPTDKELATPRTPEQFRLGLRRSTRMYYDIQEMRLQAFGRLTRKAPGATIELHPCDKLRLLTHVKGLEANEMSMLKELESNLREMPFYREVMEPKRKTQYRGLGPRMAPVILSSFDITREDTVSKMWAFAGLRPIECRRCKHCQVVVVQDKKNEGFFQHQAAKPKKPPVEGAPPEPSAVKCGFNGQSLSEANTIASARAQRPEAGVKLPYNAWLRSKLCGVLGEVLLKVGTPYRYYYDNYKHRWEAAGKGVSDKHRHVAAVRYMVKCLLADIWREWRTFEGLPVRPSYQEAYLGHAHEGSFYDTVVKVKGLDWPPRKRKTEGDAAEAPDEAKALEEVALRSVELDDEFPEEDFAAEELEEKTGT